MIEPPYPKDISILIVKIINQLSVKAFKTTDSNNDFLQFLSKYKFF